MTATKEGKNVPRAGAPAAHRRHHPGKVLVDNAEELVALVLLLLIGLSIGLQVVMRSAFNAPLSWPEELSQYFFVWASVLGAVGAAKRVGLVRVETLAEKFPPGVRRGVDAIILLAISALLGVLGWQGYQMAARSTYAATTLPLTWAWMYSAATVFAILLFVRLIQVQLFRYRFTFIEHVFDPRRAPVVPEAGAS